MESQLKGQIMMRDQNNKSQGSVSGRYREHFPPPFYKASGEYLSTVSRPAEGTIHAAEDTANYGRGGYYGHTYDQERMSRERSNAGGAFVGHRDSYRQLGDRRIQDEGSDSWEHERAFRSGYSTFPERFQRDGEQRGKGPRHYRRSDSRILEDLNDRLCDDPFLDASDMETRVREGGIMLTGTVESREARRRAEEIAEEVAGVREIENKLEIKNVHR
jgi:osmotically-inducible protein OsmY